MPRVVFLVGHPVERGPVGFVIDLGLLRRGVLLGADVPFLSTLPARRPTLRPGRKPPAHRTRPGPESWAREGVVPSSIAVTSTATIARIRLSSRLDPTPPLQEFYFVFAAKKMEAAEELAIATISAAHPPCHHPTSTRAQERAPQDQAFDISKDELNRRVAEITIDTIAFLPVWRSPTTNWKYA